MVVSRQFARDAASLLRINGGRPQGGDPTQAARHAAQRVRALAAAVCEARAAGECRDSWGRVLEPSERGPAQTTTTTATETKMRAGKTVEARRTEAMEARAKRKRAAQGRALAERVFLLANQNLGIYLFELASKRFPEALVLQTGCHSVDVTLLPSAASILCRATFELLPDSSVQTSPLDLYLCSTPDRHPDRTHIVDARVFIDLSTELVTTKLSLPLPYSPLLHTIIHCTALASLPDVSPTSLPLPLPLPSATSNGDPAPSASASASLVSHPPTAERASIFSQAATCSPLDLTSLPARAPASPSRPHPLACKGKALFA